MRARCVRNFTRMAPIVLLALLPMFLGGAQEAQAFSTIPHLDIEFVPGSPEVARFRVTSGIIPGSARGEPLRLVATFGSARKGVGMVDARFAVLQSDGSSWRPTDQGIDSSNSEASVDDAEEFVGNHLYAFGEIDLEGYGEDSRTKVVTVRMRVLAGGREVNSLSAKVTVGRGYSKSGQYVDVSDAGAKSGQPSIRLRRSGGEGGDRVNHIIRLPGISAGGSTSDRPTVLKYVTSGEIECDSIAVDEDGRELTIERATYSCAENELLLSVPRIAGGYERRAGLVINILTTGESSSYSGVLTMADRYHGLLSVSSSYPLVASIAPTAVSTPTRQQPQAPSSTPSPETTSAGAASDGSSAILAVIIGFVALGGGSLVWFVRRKSRTQN